MLRPLALALLGLLASGAAQGQPATDADAQFREILSALRATSYDLRASSPTVTLLSDIGGAIQHVLDQDWKSAAADPKPAAAPLGTYNVAIGLCAGWDLTTGSGVLLLGARTRTPTPDTNGFVNIGNRWCGWIGTGKSAPCPPPVSVEECHGQ